MWPGSHLSPVRKVQAAVAAPCPVPSLEIPIVSLPNRDLPATMKTRLRGKGSARGFAGRGRPLSGAAPGRARRVSRARWLHPVSIPPGGPAAAQACGSAGRCWITRRCLSPLRLTPSKAAGQPRRGPQLPAPRLTHTLGSSGPAVPGGRRAAKMAGRQAGRSARPAPSTAAWRSGLAPGSPTTRPAGAGAGPGGSGSRCSGGGRALYGLPSYAERLAAHQPS